MGFFSAIGTALGFINGNDTASSLAKDISEGVDVLVYTKQEKVEDKMKMTASATEAWLRMVEVMKSSEVYRSVTRRAIALFFIFNIFCLIWLCVWMEVAAYYHWFGSVSIPTGSVVTNALSASPNYTPVTWSILHLAEKFRLGWALCTIIVFYFGPALVQMMKGNKK